MHIILRYPDGSRISALLLSEQRERLRVTMPGRTDTVELKLVRERWVDDDGRKVSIEAMIFGQYDGHQGGRQTKTKYKQTSAAAKTAPPAIRSTVAGDTP